MDTGSPFLSVFPPDIAGLAEKDQAAFDAICAEVEAIDSVRTAREAHAAASARVAALNTADRAMNKRAKELFDIATKTRLSLETGLIDFFADGGDPVDSAGLFAGYATAQAERDGLMKAVARLVEHVRPLAEIAQLRAEAGVFMDRATQLKRIAEERVRKTSELLREVSGFENGLTVDLRSTLTGRIQAYAEALEGRSVEAAVAANGQERTYERLHVTVK